MNKVCVLLPHFNNIEGLYNTINSISYDEQVDLLIVDDGSEIKPQLDVLKSLFKGNGQLMMISLYKNCGIEHALNYGLRDILSKNYEFIARLDAGDFCSPSRFKIQQNYLERHKDCYLLGSWVKFIEPDTEKVLFKKKFPYSYSQIKKQMYYENLFIHPSVMFRSELINEIGLYPTNYKFCEDYAFFLNIVKKYRANILPYYLVSCIVDKNGITYSKRKIQANSRVKLLVDNFTFNIYSIYGIIKFTLIKLIPYSFILKVKTLKIRLIHFCW